MKMLTDIELPKDLRALNEAANKERKTVELPFEYPQILLPEFPKDLPKEINEQILDELKALHGTLNELLKHITNL
jgi:hypothetical protein